MGDGFTSLISIQPAGSTQTEYGTEFDRRGVQNNNMLMKQTPYVMERKWRLSKPSGVESGPGHNYYKWLSPPLESSTVTEVPEGQSSLVAPVESGDSFSTFAPISCASPTEAGTAFSNIPSSSLQKPTEDSFVGREVDFFPLFGSTQATLAEEVSKTGSPSLGELLGALSTEPEESLNLSFGSLTPLLEEELAKESSLSFVVPSILLEEESVGGVSPSFASVICSLE